MRIFLEGIYIMNLIFLQEQNSNSKVIESKNLSNDTIFKKYNVFEKEQLY